MSTWWHNLACAVRIGRAGRQSPAAVCISAVVHGCALAVFGLWSLQSGGEPAGGAIHTVWSPRSLDESLANLTAAQDEVVADVGGASLGTLPLQIGARERDLVEHLADDLPLTATTSAANAALPLTEAVLPVGGGDGSVDTAGDGQGSGHGVGDGSGTSFFGLDAAGQKFVFVVDASGSMRRPFAGPGKTLLGRVKMEILKCVTQMSPDQEFYIVFFNDHAIPMPADELVKATPDAQRHYLYWMASAKAGGNTEPEKALSIAMKLQPDVIYFLTDGAFKHRVIEHVRESNRRQATVHTVSFGGDERANEFMQRIATENGGTFHYVSPTAIRSRRDRNGCRGCSGHPLRRRAHAVARNPVSECDQPASLSAGICADAREKPGFSSPADISNRCRRPTVSAVALGDCEA